MKKRTKKDTEKTIVGKIEDLSELLEGFLNRSLLQDVDDFVAPSFNVDGVEYLSVSVGNNNANMSFDNLVDCARFEINELIYDGKDPHMVSRFYQKLADATKEIADKQQSS